MNIHHGDDINALGEGFGGCSPLHEAIMFGPVDSVKAWVSRSQKNERNFLGQTAVHFAVSRFDCLELLIDAGYDLDQADIYANTPSMYAAAMGQEESLISLLAAGADPLIRDDLYHFTTWNHGANCGHWDLLFRVLCHFDNMENHAKLVTIEFIVTRPDVSSKRSISFR